MSDLVENPEDRFSRDAALIVLGVEGQFGHSYDTYHLSKHIVNNPSKYSLVRMRWLRCQGYVYSFIFI